MLYDSTSFSSADSYLHHKLLLVVSFSFSSRTLASAASKLFFVFSK